jgi:hypothetical protein
MKPMRAFGAIVMVATAVTSCTDAATSDSGSIPQTPAPVVLGPADGHDLSGIEVDRVQVGHEAPDFTLTSLAGPTVTLSGYRGVKNVVLVFYRGHW